MKIGGTYSSMQSSSDGECSKEEELSRGTHRELVEVSLASIISSTREHEEQKRKKHSVELQELADNIWDKLEKEREEKKGFFLPKQC